MSGSGQTEAEERFTVVGLERQGLEGFLTVRQLRAAKLTEVPKSRAIRSSCRDSGTVVDVAVRTPRYVTPLRVRMYAAAASGRYGIE